MKKYIKSLKDIYCQVGNRIFLFCTLSVVSALTNGIGILLIFPLLYITGVFKGSYGSNIFFYILSKLIPRLNTHLGLIIVLAIYIAILVLKAFLDRAVSILMINIISEYKEKIMVEYFTNLTETDWTYYITKSKSQLMNSILNDTERVKSGLYTQLTMLSNIILAIVHILLSVIISWKATILILVIGAVSFIYISPYIKKMHNIGNDQRKTYKDLINEVMQQMESLKDIKIYGLQDEHIKNFSKCTSAIRRTMIEFNVLSSKPTLIYKIIAPVVISFFIYYCIEIANIHPASLITIILIFAKLWPLYSSFQNDIQNYTITLPSYSSLRSQIEEFIKHKTITSLEQRPIEIEKSIEFKNVYFSYPQSKDNLILDNISFTIPKNKITALVGKSGSGKTTIADMLVGLLQPVQGYILVDNGPLNNEFLKSWQSQIAYVQQDSFLFNCSIKENLLIYAPYASNEDIDHALYSACAEFVHSLPLGINTIIGDRGVTLSGGERQRIILARALIRKPKFLILDEATSSLDNENEHRIQKIIEDLSKDITILVIAHRLSTVKRSDTIVAINKGHVVEIGSYKELSSKNNGFLYEMIEVTNAV
jgi:ATP-binding cassette subfamily C protein